MQEGAGGSHPSSGPQGKTGGGGTRRSRKINQVEMHITIEITIKWEWDGKTMLNARMCVPEPKLLGCQQQSFGEN